VNFAICGDSWFSSDVFHPGKSFGERIAVANNWNLVSLARGGCSNFAISLQVDKAIDLGCDLIIVGCTTPDRIEIPIVNEQNKNIWEKIKKNLNWNNWAHIQPEVYSVNRGISNILYRHIRDLSNKNPWVQNPTVISESINNLIFLNPYNLDSDQLTALKYYIEYLYDNGIKRQIDCWIMSDCARRLIRSGIPFLFYIEPLFDPGDHYQSGFNSNIDWVDKKNLILPSQFSYYALPNDHAGSFHYDIEQGAEIFTNYIEQRIKDLI
jgi:hypothetical protein